MIQLPAWARVSARRLEHIERVVALLEMWADDMRLPPDETTNWIDAGRFHDALRDASEAELEDILGDQWARITPPSRHGHAAAEMLERDGDARRDVLQAVRWHTVGFEGWQRTGKALFMAVYLEPGRKVDREARAELAARVPHEFERVFVEVARDRLSYLISRNLHIFPETVAMWNSLV
jgi:2-amino-4-hydroxy-6-hydroxymethyldihydropteridine diphosphokinase